jgi:fumarate reductase flavoprotein subunit
MSAERKSAPNDNSTGVAARGAGGSDPAPWYERRWDLVVVGGGTSGLTATAFGGRRGNVLLLDAAPEIGGSLLIAYGQISAAGTRLQREKGIVDSPELHYEEAIRISKGTIDPDIARLAIFNAGETFDWLMDNGFECVPDNPSIASAHEPYSVARYYWSPELGKGIAKVLIKAVDESVARGTVTVRTSTKVVGLRQAADGAVTGVHLVEADGTKRTVATKNVLLATGGYAANAEMFQRMVGRPLYAKAAYEYCTGDGLEFGMAAGGFVRGREKYLSNFGWLLEDDRFPSPIIGRLNTYPADRPPWEIYVNSAGERFIREDEPSVDVREHTLLEQPDLRYWVVFDQPIFERAPPMAYNWTREQMAAAFGTKFAFTKADTLEQLATKIGVDPAALVATVNDYNEAQRTGRDAAFGRTHMPAPIGTGPFYAIRQQGASVSATVGIAVDAELRVIREDRTPIPGLYASGEILGSGQLQGNAFVGGMMAMPALVFGKLLGERMIPF